MVSIVVFKKLHMFGTSIFSFYSVYIYFYGKQSYRLYCDHIESHCLQSLMLTACFSHHMSHKA